MSVQSLLADIFKESAKTPVASITQRIVNAYTEESRLGEWSNVLSGVIKGNVTKVVVITDYRSLKANKNGIELGTYGQPCWIHLAKEFGIVSSDSDSYLRSVLDENVVTVGNRVAALISRQVMLWFYFVHSDHKSLYNDDLCRRSEYRTKKGTFYIAGAGDQERAHFKPICAENLQADVRCEQWDSLVKYNHANAPGDFDTIPNTLEEQNKWVRDSAKIVIRASKNHDVFFTKEKGVRFYSNFTIMIVGQLDILSKKKKTRLFVGKTKEALQSLQYIGNDLNEWRKKLLEFEKAERVNRVSRLEAKEESCREEPGECDYIELMCSLHNVNVLPSWFDHINDHREEMPIA